MSRWLRLLALGVVAWAASTILIVWTRGTFVYLASGLASLGPWLLEFVVFALATAILFCHVAGRARAFLTGGHLLHHPPLWSAIVVALLVHTVVLPVAPSLRSTELPIALELSLLWVLVLLLIASGCAAVACFLWMSPNVRSDAVHDRDWSLEDIDSNPALIDRWLDEDDRPIRLPTQDLFNRRQISRRIATRLAGERACTILVRGAAGAGKTSLLAMTQHYLDVDRWPKEASLSQPLAQRASSPRVFVTRVSAWAFNDSSALITGVLHAVIQQIGRIADTLALVGIPSSYVAAISSAGGLIGSVAPLLAMPRTPEDNIHAIGETLAAIRCRVVVWIDDLERFTNNHGRDEPVQALLSMMRECPQLSFILAEGTSGSSTPVVDYHKLITFVESMPRLDPLEVGKVVRLFRDAHRERFGDINPRPVPSVDAYRPVTPFDEALMKSVGAATVWGAVGTILDSPRKIKFALRRAREAWSHLHGEVQFDEMLLVRVLHESEHRLSWNSGSGSVDASLIDVLDLEVDWLRDQNAKAPRTYGGENRPTPRQAALLEMMKLRGPEQVLLEQLFGRPGAQGVATTGSVDYWRRIRSEACEPGPTDQQVLASIDEFGKKPTDVPDLHLHPLVQSTLADSPFPSSRILPFATQFTDAHFDRLARLVVDRVIEDDDRLYWDDRHPLGLVNLSRLCNELRVPASRRIPLAKAAIERAMRRSLHLVTDIEYWLMMRPSDVKSFFDTRQELQEVADFVGKQFLAEFCSANAVDRLVTAIGSSFWSLSWMINREWDRTGTKSRVDWSQAATYLLAAGEASIDSSGRALIPLVFSGGRRRGGPTEASGSREEVQSEVWVTTLDSARAESLFGNRVRDAMRIISRVSAEGLTGQERALCQDARILAERWSG